MRSSPVPARTAPAQGQRRKARPRSRPRLPDRSMEPRRPWPRFPDRNRPFRGRNGLGDRDAEHRLGPGHTRPHLLRLHGRRDRLPHRRRPVPDTRGSEFDQRGSGQGRARPGHRFPRRRSRPFGPEPERGQARHPVAFATGDGRGFDPPYPPITANETEGAEPSYRPSILAFRVKPPPAACFLAGCSRASPAEQPEARQNTSSPRL